jgi:hypothetical protein
MRPGNHGLVAAIVAGTLAASASLGAAVTEDGPAPNAPRPGVERRALDDSPGTRDKVIAVGGGVLVVTLTALGLTITFRSLGTDMRGRKRRYRRRARRETNDK